MGVMADCPRCGNPSYFEARRCRSEAVLRCSWCRAVVKKGIRPPVGTRRELAGALASALLPGVVVLILVGLVLAVQRWVP
jgi:hypothetical protein